MRRWVESLITAQVDGGAVGNTITATSLLPVAAKKRWGAGDWLIGKKLVIDAHGRVSVSGSALNLTLDVRFMGAPDAASPTTVVVANGGVMAMTTTAAKTNVSWRLRMEMVCRAIGASANLMFQGQFTSEAFGATSVVGEAKSALLPASAPAVGNNFDSTQIQVVDLFATWGTAAVGNTIQLHGYELLSEN